MPGFGPAAEVLLFWQKDPKPLTPRPASLDETDARLRRADQLAEPALRFIKGLQQGPPGDKSVRPEGQTAGVGRWGEGGSGPNE